MLLKIDNPRGIVPKLAATSLAENNAQTAKDCDLSNGTIALYSGVSDSSNWLPGNITPVDFPVLKTPTCASTDFFTTGIFTVKTVVSTGADAGSYTLSEYSPFTSNTSSDIKFNELDNAGDFLYLRYQHPTTIDIYNASHTVTVTYDGVTQTVWQHIGRDTQTTLSKAKTAIFYLNDTDTGIILPIIVYGTYSRNKGVFEMRVSFDRSGISKKYVRYLVRAVDSENREGPISAITTGVIIKDVEYNVLTFQAGDSKILTVGDFTPTKLALYRSDFSLGETKFYRINYIDWADTTYNDYLGVSSYKNNVIPEYDNIMLYGNPPAGLTGVIRMSTDFYVGYVGDTVYFTDVGKNNVAWIDDYKMQFDYDIVKLYPLNNACIVLTEEASYAIFGGRPWEHFSILLDNKACLSAAGTLYYNESVFYVSYDGLVEVKPRSTQMATYNLFTIPQWRALTPATITLTEYQSGIFIKTASAEVDNYFLDVKNGILTSTTVTAIDSSPSEYVWKSKKFYFDKPTTFFVGRLLSNSTGTMYFELFGDGVRVFDDTVSVNTSFKLSKAMGHWVYWEIRITGTVPVTQIAIANSEDELRGVLN